MTAAVPPSGRLLRDAVTAAVVAARVRDRDALRDACARLRDCDDVLTRDVLHRLTLGLIEQAFPDGLDAADIRGLLTDVLRPAAAWLPGLDSHAVVVVLAGALSVQETDGDRPVSPAGDALPVACALMVDHLLRQLDLRVESELARAIDELRTSQTMEMP